MGPERVGTAGSDTWHHGLVARWWADFNVARPEELAYYRAAIERFGQPALDLACGAGRILLPLLEAGFEVDGVDVSADMLQHARRLGEPRDLRPQLHQQAMHELDLPRRYGTIFICDSFGIGTNRAGDLEVLRRAHAHLDPGGALLISHDLPYGAMDAARWGQWLPGNQMDGPDQWPDRGERRRTADGDEIELIQRTVELDPLGQSWTLELRARLWRDGQLMAEEDRRLRINLYFAEELLLMLEAAGFRDVRVEGYYTSRPATRDDGSVIFVAQK